jgi:tripartite-type tricarboxylate transporter receptor subunit TctC
MHRRSFFTLAAALLAGGIAAPGAMAQAYPDRPIEMIEQWGDGGGTDAVGRLIASQLQEELGVPVNVVNRTGGSGVVGHSAIANAAPDGYTIGIMTIEIDMMHWQGLTDLTYADYDILALVNADPGGLMVAADSEYDSAEALLEAIKAGEPGAFKASGTGQGGIWHLGILGWILSEGLPANQITWVPSVGANPGLTDMVAGGVDIVPSSLAEGRALIEADRVKALATMSTEKQGLFPDVPTLSEATGSDWTIAAWRSVVAPKGLPEDVKATLAAAVEKAFHIFP